MIVRLEAGLGNQMFQWAFGRCVSAVRNEELFFEKHDLDGGNPRAYSLGAFDIDLKFKEPDGAPQFIETHEKFGFDPDVYKVPNGTHFIGNWQTEKYFDGEMVRRELGCREPFSSQTLSVGDQIVREPASCSVHVRRTDYLIPSTIAYHGDVGLDYYDRAMDSIGDYAPDVQFFVFSDDPEWCKDNFRSPCRVVDHNKPGSGATGPGKEHEDLYLMSLCRHAIIPNSSFGWWGCWLRDPKNQGLTIAPKVWFRKEGLRYDDIVPDRWIKL